MATNPIDYRAVLEDIESKILKLQAAADAIREMVSVTDAPKNKGPRPSTVYAFRLPFGFPDIIRVFDC